MKNGVSRFILLLSLAAIAAGLGLRVASFSWNKYIHGDVNLFALAAREFINHGRLNYPMKYEYSPNVPYLTLRSPASQHPPLWPFLAGVLGKLSGSDNSFLMLKLWSGLFGLLLMVVVMVAGLRAGWGDRALIAALGIAISPTLVDFSANGSMYILCALELVLSTFLLINFRYDSISDYFLAGVISGLSVQTHSAMLCIPIAFIISWLLERSRLRWLGIPAFLLTTLMVVGPWIAWNLAHFGKPFYSYSPYYFYRQFKLARLGIYDGEITTYISSSLSLSFLKMYLTTVFNTAVKFSRRYLSEIGPFSLGLVMVGLYVLFRKESRYAIRLILPATIYSLIICLWATFRFRFLVPVLPTTLVLAALGFVSLCQKRPLLRVLAWALLFGMIGWSGLGFFELPHSRYYHGEDGKDIALYEKMLPLAQALGRREAGTVLGYSGSLDGGRETVYYHRFPFVAGRAFLGGEREFRKLVRDFTPRYIWTDESSAELVRNWLPEAKVILKNGPYQVFEFHGPMPTEKKK